MNIKRVAFIVGSVFLAIVALAVCVSARFSLSNITSDPYTFISSFFNQWSLALSATGTIILAISVFAFIYENRRREEREEQQVIHALHNEIHWNLRPIITLRYDISEWSKRVKESNLISTETEGLYKRIETRVFDDMRSRGQLHWLEELRMDVVFCYSLIDTYNLDIQFKPEHLELLTKLHERLDKTIRALEAKFKFLPRYVRYEDSESADEQKTNQNRTDQASDATHDKVRKEYFLALAPAYLAGSYYLMQVSSNSTTGHLLWFSYTLPVLPPYGGYINIGLSVFFLLWALFLIYLAFGKIWQSSKDTVYRIVAGLSGLAIIFYMYDWIKNLVGIIESGMSVWYFYLFYIIGLIVIAAVAAYPYTVLLIWLRKRIKSS